MKNYALPLLLILFTLVSCTKNEPTPEIDQEELGSAKLIFTPVSKDQEKNIYTEIDGAKAMSIEFKGYPLLPPAGEHIHLTTGLTYKLELVSYDFAGREVQNTFLQRAETHQAFLLNAPTGCLNFEYGDDQVGVTSYLTVVKDMEVKMLRFIMRHLNPGVKSRITTSDWNNQNYIQFTGANDLELKFDAHFSGEDHLH